MWKKLTSSGREERLLELLLRVGVAGCFVGHGAFGIIGKEGWLPYFAVAGIGEEWAWRLMPVVGTIDVLIGVLSLIAPRPVFLAYGAGWAMWTALLRPLAGESVFETLERAGNYGIPIAFLLLVGSGLTSRAAWWRTIEVPRMTPAVRERVMIALRATTSTLLAGHGGLALLGTPLLERHAATVGLPEGALAVVGAFELALASAVAIRPAASLLLFVLAWKMGTEALHPVAGAPFWEFVERAGSYVAPLALWTMVRGPVSVRVSPWARTASAVLGIAFTIGWAAGAAPAVGQATEASFAVDRQEALLSRLRAGGFVLACRHAITDRSRGDENLDFEDRSTQRVLSREGEEQARRLGAILREQRIPIGEVFTSRFFRASDSAELTFGRAEVHEALYSFGRNPPPELRALFTRVPADGTNRALMTHQGILYQVLTEVERGSIREGDCVVVEPDGRDFEVVARLGPDEWAALR